MPLRYYAAMSSRLGPVLCGSPQNQDYAAVLQLQRSLQNEVREGGAEWLLLLEHPAVFTLGRGHPEPRLRVARTVVEAAGIPIVETERGGDITYHGPGQLVAYAILDLRVRGIGVTEFVHGLEEAALLTLRQWDVEGRRDRRNRGVWVGGRKIAAIGVNVRRGVSMHGIALNVSPNMDHFGLIEACGLPDVEATSIERETGRAPSITEVGAAFAGHFAEAFDLSVVDGTPGA
jgi:lipoyl(octanoyl) transferase